MSDFERDHRVDAVFSEIGAVVAEHLSPAGVDAVFNTVRRRRRNRVMAAGVLALALVAGPAAGLTLTREHRSEPPETGQTTAPSPTGSPTPTPTPTPAGSSAPPEVPDGWISAHDVRNATIRLSPWPEGSECPSGRVKFTNGVASRGQAQIAPEVDGKPVYADVDGDGAQETAITIACHPQWADYQVIVLDRDESGKIITFGHVVATVGPSGENGADIKKVWGIRAAPGGRISVDVGDYSPCCAIPQDLPQHQWRTYGWNGDKFVQTGGPTEFGPNPHITDLTLAAEPAVLTKREDGKYEGTVQVTIGNKGQFPAKIGLSVTGDFGLSGMVDGRKECKIENDVTITCNLETTLDPGESRTVPVTLTAAAQIQTKIELNAASLSSTYGSYPDLDYKNDLIDITVKTSE